MKKRFSLFVIVLTVCSAMAETHITIDDPSTWTWHELSPYIGETVVFDSPLVVCSNAGSGSILTVSPRRLFTVTNQVFPRMTNHEAYHVLDSLNSDGAVSLSGISGYHRCGEKIYHLKAKINSATSMTWVSGEWRGNTRTEMEAGIPDVGDYRLLICTMNLEYYLAAGLGSGSMGPRTKEAHQRQRTKVNKALTKINADAYGFVEIESGDVALQEIATDLNAKLPSRKYTFIHDGTSPEGTYTKAGFVYDANVLEPIGSIQETDAKVKNRKKMICFREKATGEKFIFSVNHFKAKRGSAGGADADKFDGQGAFNATRVEEAQAVVEKYHHYSSARAIKEKDILIMGDLNAYAKEDPIMVFIRNGMIDLHRTFQADSSYSYQFGGLAGYLDHALCNATMYNQVTGAAGYHINSDENDEYTYDGAWSDNSMFRCSDHDPVIVGLALDSTLSMEFEPTVIETTWDLDSVSLANMYDNSSPDAKSYFAIYSIDGLVVCPVTEIRFSEELLQQDNPSYRLNADNPYLPEEMKQLMPLQTGIYIIHLYFRGNIHTFKIIIR